MASTPSKGNGRAEMGQYFPAVGTRFLLGARNETGESSVAGRGRGRPRQPGVGLGRANNRRRRVAGGLTGSEAAPRVRNPNAPL
jgi:hypothetical protein